MASLQNIELTLYILITIFLAVAISKQSPIHTGQISSYLKAVFKPESGVRLNHFLVSDASGTEYVYLAGVDTVFQLDVHFTQVQSENTSDDCDTVDNDNKVLVVAPPPFYRLILCRGCDGYCEFRFLHDVSRDRIFNQERSQIAVNQDLSNVGIFSEGADRKLYLFVAASWTQNGVRSLPLSLISQRSLENAETPFVAERHTAKAKSTVMFLQGFVWKDFIFFLVHEFGGDALVRSSKLGRLCSKTTDNNLAAYSEIPLTCGPYGMIKAAHIGSDEVLYAVFTDGANSALCSYKMTDVQDKFVDATCGCSADLSHAPECHLLGKTIDYINGGVCDNRVGVKKN